MPKLRLDTLLMERGLAPSRERARALILAGKVLVNGQVVSKAGAPVAAEAAVSLKEPDIPYVSRGGVKLAAALRDFGLNVAGKVALDVGASTGGFTDCLLQAGAARVYAVDVGYGQLDWRLRQDPRVISRERLNARYLTADALPEPVEVAVIDVSFISLKLILPPVSALVKPGGEIIVLVKPQFEVGKGQVGKGGVVRDPAVQLQAVAEVTAAAEFLGLRAAGCLPSPILGPKGNQEYLLRLRKS